MLHPNCHGLLQLHNFHSLDLTWIQVNPPAACFRPEYLALCFIQTAMVFFNCTAPDYVWSSEKSIRIQSPLQSNAAMCVSLFTSPPLSRILQSSQVTTLCISDDHISMITIPEVFISGKKFWVYKFTVSHFFFIYNNDPNSSHPTSHPLSFQLPPLLVALPVPRAIS